MLITENQLHEWVCGNSESAKGIIVDLVSQLVTQSCPQPRYRRFQQRDSIGQVGSDGELNVDFGFPPFVPDGRSFWEIGTGLGSRDKATSDYRKETSAIPEDVRREATFVFVTPLSGHKDWPYSWKRDGQARWLNERMKRHDWGDVRIIDGTRLIDWLSRFPAVEAWLAENTLRLPAWQIERLDARWKLTSSIGAPPPLPPDLFLANRTDACSKLGDVLNGGLIRLKLTTRYPDQVVDFVSAYVATLGEEARADVLGRSLIVSGIDGWNAMCERSQSKNHILVASASLDLSGDDGARLLQKARRAGHAVIFGGPPGGIPDPSSIIALRMPRIDQVQEAISSAGYTAQRAGTLARQSGGNLSSLLRCLQNPSVLPEWAQDTEAADLAIALLLGSWDGTSRADREVAQSLSGKAYGEWIQSMHRSLLRASTPLTQQQNHWRFIPRFEGWHVLGERLCDEDVDRLHDIAVATLMERDPRFDLSPEQRMAACIGGHVFAHSVALRNGLAESLALLGTYPGALSLCSSGKAEGSARRAVRSILAGADCVLWASLSDLLPLLAEASPAEFLDQVESALQSNPCPFDRVFAQEDGGVFGRSYMAGLLWALETLAWDPDALSRAVVCLGGLAARDPGGQWGNRPSNSLTTILLPWMPQTCAPMERRVAAVAALLREHADVGWKTLVSLLPGHQQITSPTRRPAWRTSIPDQWQQGATHGQYAEQVVAYTEMAVTEAKRSAARLAELVSELAGLPLAARAMLREYLGSESVLTMPDAAKMRLWNALLELIAKHRRFADANWAMALDELDELDRLATKLAPSSPFLLHQRLFGDGDSELLDGQGKFEEQLGRLEDLRRGAIQEIASAGGAGAILAFAQAVQAPWHVGIAFGHVADSDRDAHFLPDLLTSEDKALAQFVGGYVTGRFRRGGWAWIDGIVLADWTPAQMGQLMSFLPFVQDTWQRVGVLLGQDQSAYWTRTTASPYGANAELEYAIDQLIQYGRPHRALSCLHEILRTRHLLLTEKAAQALLQAVSSSEGPHAMDSYETVEIIKALQRDPHADAEALAQVEWAYLPLLDEHNGGSPLFLSGRLAEDPTFFCQVIRLIFRSRTEVSAASTVDKRTERRAENAYRLLRKWHTPPGSRRGGGFDGDGLIAWLKVVKEACAASGHLEVAMTMVGHVLAHAPADESGLWIDRSVAEVLNDSDAQDLRDGFWSEIYNSRGVHFVDPTGEPERQLAAKYRSRADAVDNVGCQRLAVTLRALATTYEGEAKSASADDAEDT